MANISSTLTDQHAKVRRELCDCAIECSPAIRHRPSYDLSQRSTLARPSPVSPQRSVMRCPRVSKSVTYVAGLICYPCRWLIRRVGLQFAHGKNTRLISALSNFRQAEDEKSARADKETGDPPVFRWPRIFGRQPASVGEPSHRDDDRERLNYVRSQLISFDLPWILQPNGSWFQRRGAFTCRSKRRIMLPPNEARKRRASERHHVRC